MLSPVDEKGAGDSTTGDLTRRDSNAHLPVIGWRLVIVWALLAVLVTSATTVVLWLASSAVDSARASAQLDAIKTGLSVGVGAGGLFALWLATRRQRSTEIGLTQQERTIDATIADADERRVTELYTRAAEQIGHDKAPVRLAGAYALERLAQDNERHRQTIVNVLCSYLRMPFKDVAVRDPRIGAGGVEEQIGTLEEREIRVTIQRMLCEHLRPRRFTPTKSDEDQPREQNSKFWPGISLNLDGAVLINFDFRACEVESASFHYTTFTGSAQFRNATFADEAVFKRAVFQHAASFDNVHFGGFAWFWRARFKEEVTFSGATFAGTAGFKVAEFTGNASFRNARFRSAALFESCAFRARAAFENAEFDEASGFSKAVFDGDVHLTHVTFGAGAWFRDVRFHARAKLTGSTFQYGCFRRARFQSADFRNTTFEGIAEFTMASFDREAIFAAARFHQAALFVSATFVRVAKFDGVVFGETANFQEAEIQLNGKFKGTRFDGPTRLSQDDLDLVGASFGAQVDSRDVELPTSWVRADEPLSSGRYPVDAADPPGPG